MRHSTCTIAGCDKPPLARGLCNAHYRRWRRHGDPLAGRESHGHLPFREARVCDCGAHGFVGLTRGFVTLVSPKHVPSLVGRKWAVAISASAYARLSGRSNVQLHRMLTDAPAGLSVDHRDGDTLNNQDENLRICNQSQNTANSRRIRGAVPFKGVCEHTPGYFRAYIKVNRVRRELGCFRSPEEAARAYDDAAVAAWGEFAATNARLGLLSEVAA